MAADSNAAQARWSSFLGDCAGWQIELVSDANVVVADAAGKGGKAEGRSGLWDCERSRRDALLLSIPYVS
jgi:hypothetical protein